MRGLGAVWNMPDPAPGVELSAIPLISTRATSPMARSRCSRARQGGFINIAGALALGSARPRRSQFAHA